MTDNCYVIDYNELFEIWADFDDEDASDDVKKLVGANGLGRFDAMSFIGFCYGYEKAVEKLKGISAGGKSNDYKPEN